MEPDRAAAFGRQVLRIAAIALLTLAALLPSTSAGQGSARTPTAAVGAASLQVPISTGATATAARVGEEGVAGAAVFHHTTTEAAESIMRHGLRPGSYATPTRGLSPIQAHIELALNPAGGARNAVIEVDLAGLRNAGYEIPQVTRVSGAYKMAGGGYEMQFPYEIPPEYLRVGGR